MDSNGICATSRVSYPFYRHVLFAEGKLPAIIRFDFSPGYTEFFYQQQPNFHHFAQDGNNHGIALVPHFRRGLYKLIYGYFFYLHFFVNYRYVDRYPFLAHVLGNAYFS